MLVRYSLSSSSLFCFTPSFVQYYEAAKADPEVNNKELYPTYAAIASVIDSTEIPNLIRGLQTEEIPTDVSSFNQILDALATVGNKDLAFKFFSTMENMGIRPDSRTFEMLQLVCFNADDAETTIRIYDQLLASGFPTTLGVAKHALFAARKMRRVSAHSDPLCDLILACVVRKMP